MGFEELYDKYFQRVYNYIRYRVLARDAADDLVSAVFEKVLDKFDAYDRDKPVEPWLFAIARNTLNDYYRRRAVRGGLSLDGFEERLGRIGGGGPTGGAREGEHPAHRALRREPDSRVDRRSSR